MTVFSRQPYSMHRAMIAGMAISALQISSMYGLKCAPRFLLLELGNISLFVSSVLPGNLEHPIEASAYDTNGRPIFQ